MNIGYVSDVFCYGPDACSGAEITLEFTSNINCNGPGACDGAELELDSTLTCTGGSSNKPACTDTTEVSNSAGGVVVFCQTNGCTAGFIAKAEDNGVTVI